MLFDEIHLASQIGMHDCYVTLLKGVYSWIAHQIDIGTTLRRLLLRFNFKSETSFGFPAQTTPGKVPDFFGKTTKRARCASFQEKVFSRVF